MKRISTFALMTGLVLAGCYLAVSAMADDKTPASNWLPVDFTPATTSPVSPQDAQLLEQINQANIHILAAVRPAIVRITANVPLDNRLQQMITQQLPFRFGPGGRNVPQSEPVFGSGVIISKDGYIVTNNHVVEGAKEVSIELQDKRSFPARVIATDAPMDVAVLKIDATDLTPLPFGDSDKVQVGEQVFAIGSPFNLEDSASKGIVSAMKRNLPEDAAAEGPHYEDYIQTDAAINPGNSGGALINVHGELIGINTAIASTSHGSMGVGFAIPSNLVRYAVNGLLKDGKLVRGYLGVLLPESVDEGVVDALHLGTNQGALLADVKKSSPAEQAGLHSGDFITAIDGHKVSSIAELRLIVAQLPVGKEVQVDYIRSGTGQTTKVKIGLPDAVAASGGVKTNDTVTTPPVPVAETTTNALSGLQFGDLDDKSRRRFNVDPIVTAGVVINNVLEGSPADAKGVARGDVIESICVDRGETKPVSTAKDLTDLAKDLKPNQSVVLLVHHERGGSFIYIAPQK